MMKKVLFLILFILLLQTGTFSQAQNSEITTLILVRHSEKMDDSQDPGLLPQGVERSRLLARMFAETEFDAVYSTPYIRTRETVRLIAEQNQIDITEYQPEDIETFGARLVENHRGGHVLISGHSNTVPQLANALLGRQELPGNFDESDYDNILVVTISSDGSSGLLHLKY